MDIEAKKEILNIKFLYENVRKLFTFHRHTGVDGSQQIRASDILGLTTGSGINGLQVFTSSGTFTPPVGFINFWVRIRGGGGGGGSPNDVAASGGGQGGYSEKFCIITSPVSVTIAAKGTGGTANGAGTDGGDTIFGSFFTAPGGKGGGITTSNGAGGVPTTGDLNISGQDGGIAMQIGATAYNISGIGGGGTPNVVATGAGKTNGITGKSYGDGGSGASSGTSATGFPTGGDGVQGFCVIIW